MFPGSPTLNYHLLRYPYPFPTTPVASCLLLLCISVSSCIPGRCTSSGYRLQQLSGSAGACNLYPSLHLLLLRQHHCANMVLQQITNSLHPDCLFHPLPCATLLTLITLFALSIQPPPLDGVNVYRSLSAVLPGSQLSRTCSSVVLSFYFVCSRPPFFCSQRRA